MARLRLLLVGLAAMAMAGTLLSGSAEALTATAHTAPVYTATVHTDAGTGTGAPSATATFGIQPATSMAIDKRNSLTYEATDGAVKTDYVGITNYTSSPLQLHVYATDAYNSSDGGFTVLPSATKPTDIGLWVSFGRQFITVPAKTTAIMPFLLRVPATAAPGDHTGGIMVALTTVTYNAKGNQIAIESRVGTRLSVRVPGKLRASVTVTDVSVDYHNSLNPVGSGSATVSYTITNTGNVRLAGTQAVRVTSLIGGSKQSAPIPNIKELLPGDSMRVTTNVNGVLPSFFSTVRITVAPAGLPGDLDPKASSVEQSATMTTFPWPLILLLLLIGAGAYMYLRRRRRNAALAEPDQPSKTKPSGTGPKPGPEPGPKSTATVPRPKPRPKAVVPVPKTGAKSGTANK